MGGGGGFRAPPGLNRVNKITKCQFKALTTNYSYFLVYGQADSSDCLEDGIRKECRNENANQFLPQLAKTIISQIDGNQSKAKEDLGCLCELVTLKRWSHIMPLTEEFEAFTTIISGYKFLNRITPASFRSGLIPLRIDNAGISSYASALNSLGILAIELSMPHKAIELFCLQQQYLNQNNIGFLGSTGEAITLNNYGISHALVGEYKKATEYLNKARAIGIGMRKMNQVFASSAIAAVLSNLGRDKLVDIHESLCTLGIEDKPRLTSLAAAKLVKVYLKTKQNKKADEQLETLSPVLTKLDLWTEDMIIDELDILLPVQIAEIVSLKREMHRANDILKKALKMCRFICDEEHPFTAELLYKRGLVCYLLEDYNECAAMLLEAAKIFKLCYNENCPCLCPVIAS